MSFASSYWEDVDAYLEYKAEQEKKEWKKKDSCWGCKTEEEKRRENPHQEEYDKQFEAAIKIIEGCKNNGFEKAFVPNELINQYLFPELSEGITRGSYSSFMRTKDGVIVTLMSKE